MDILIYCLLAAIFLPYITKIPLAIAMHQHGGYDNKNPRGQQAKLEGFGARALAAHQNAFESLIVFSAAIATALATNNTDGFIQYLAIVHIIARVIYMVLYLLNWDKLRSIVWATGLFASVAIVWNCLT
jgi:uncharacterized MAPEG superfamily protein